MYLVKINKIKILKRVKKISRILKRINKMNKINNENIVKQSYNINGGEMKYNQSSLEILLDRTDIKKKKPRKRPKRLENPFEMLKYFISHTSLHGIKYVQDVQLYKIERVIWLLLVIIAFSFAADVILRLYCKFQTKKTNILIDDINYDIFQIPFPSVTLCPGTRIDWKELTKLANTLIPATNEEAKNVLYKLSTNMSKLRFSYLHKLDIQADRSVLQLLDKINVTDLLIKVMPKCEEFIYNCSWSYTKRNCCEIFELQRTSFGFCYTFNSLTSVEKKLTKPYKTHAYGFRSGLKVQMRKDKLNYPPNDRENQTAAFIISHPQIYPSKARYIAFGRRYNVGIKFTSALATAEVRELENTDNPPCRYQHGEYRFENCLTICQQQYIKRVCGCNPGFFFPIITGDIRECNITDFRCLAKENAHISEVHFSLSADDSHVVKSMCNCPPECAYCNYDDFVIGLPYYEPNSISLDIHYDGPTGVRYKREIVVSDLDMLVQLGGIFGLFMGGSLLSLLEFTYCFVVGMIFYVYKCLDKERKKDEIKVQQVINVTPYNEKRMYPLLDYPIVLKQNKPRY